jgi:5-methylcytosine-specific restriction enzyme subunit McrC
MRTLTLPEYQQLLDVQLDEEDLKAFAPFSPKQLVITPSFSSSGYDLSASSWVGTIKTPGLALVLEPKVTIARLLFLLSYALDPKRWRDIPFDYRPTNSLVEAIIPGFVHQVRRALRQGVHQGYLSRADALNTVRGRIDFAQQLRRRHGRMPPVEVVYDEFTEDILENRVLKAAIHRLGRLQLRSPVSRGALRTLGSAFERVSLVEFDGRRVPEVFYTRLNEHYRPAVELARLILRATSVDLSHGRARSSAFLVDMNKVFESFVAVALREALHADERTFPTPEKAPPLRLDARQRVRLKPDLTWLHNRRRVFVGDVKYKRLRAAGYLHPDLYQALAYTVATKLDDAMLIYAAGEAEDATHQVVHIDKRVHVRTLKLGASPGYILDQINHLADEVRELSLSPSQVGRFRIASP